jgi:hypothetical protein
VARFDCADKLNRRFNGRTGTTRFLRHAVVGKVLLDNTTPLHPALGGVHVLGAATEHTDGLARTTE